MTTSAPTPRIGRTARDQIEQVEPGLVGPAVDRDVAAARVEADRDLAGMQRRELVDDLGVLDRGAADHDARRARREPVARHRPPMRTPPPVCTLDVDGGADRFDRAEVRVAAVERGVEIDDVDPARARVGEPARDRDRVVAVDRSRAS